jgi:hypothetical protein
MKRIKRNVRVIRINPFNRSIAAVMMKTDLSAVRQKLQASADQELGTSEFMLGGQTLSLIAKMQAPDGEPGFRFRGQEIHKETAGLTVLVSYGPNNGLINCDVSIELIKREIVWVDNCWEAEKTKNMEQTDDQSEG